MVQDTIIAVIMCVLPSHPIENGSRFESLFQEADSTFEVKYHVREKYRRMFEKASEEAVRSASEKTAQQREKAMKSECDFRQIMEELKNQNLYIFRYNEKK